MAYKHSAERGKAKLCVFNVETSCPKLPFAAVTYLGNQSPQPPYHLRPRMRLFYMPNFKMLLEKTERVTHFNFLANETFCTSEGIA